MWRPWGKSTVRVHSTSSSPSHSNSSSLFSCSSFKDIQTLCLDETPLPSPSPTIKPSVFHRVRLANSLLRTWSTHLPPQQPPKLPRTLSNSTPELDAPPISQPDPVQVPLQQTTPKLHRSLSQPLSVFQPELESVPEPDSPTSDPTPFIPGTEQRVVVYYTSLRVVRPTFEACKSVLSILSGFRVLVDDRDVSMDSGLLTELNRIIGQTGLTLPRVFIGGRYLGGAEEVKLLNEIGELKKMLEKLPVADQSQCHVCGAHRFVLCNECDGSGKVYTEKIGFKTCNACNEHGLVRCPSCFSTPLLS